MFNNYIKHYFNHLDRSMSKVLNQIDFQRENL